MLQRRLSRYLRPAAARSARCALSVASQVNSAVAGRAAVGCGLFVDWRSRLSMLMMPFDAGSKCSFTSAAIFFVRDHAGASVDHRRHRFGDADGVGHPHLALLGQTAATTFLAT